MSKRKELAGQKFGMLTPIKYLSTTQHPELKRGAWECRCECGNTTIVPSYELLSGGTKSCGCLKTKPHFKDLTGQKFGKWTPIRRATKEESKYGGMWLCQCQCGTQKIISSTALQSGTTRGCKTCSYTLKDKPKNDLTGQKFGKVHVDSWTRTLNPKTNKKVFTYNCTCDCGTKFQTKRPDTIQSCGCMRKEHPNNLPENITGQKFASLTALHPAEDHITIGGRHIKQWVFQCDCGNIVTCRVQSVKNGSTKSCGCLVSNKVQKTAQKRYKETGYNKYTHLSLKIIDYKKTSDITVQFPDGQTVEHTKYSLFKAGQIAHPAFKMNQDFHGYTLIKHAFTVNDIPYWYVYPKNQDTMDILTAQQMIDKDIRKVQQCEQEKQ